MKTLACLVVLAALSLIGYNGSDVVVLWRAVRFHWRLPAMLHTVTGCGFCFFPSEWKLAKKSCAIMWKCLDCRISVFFLIHMHFTFYYKYSWITVQRGPVTLFHFYIIDSVQFLCLGIKIYTELKRLKVHYKGKYLVKFFETKYLN